jgi:translocation and assembly module TamB
MSSKTDVDIAPPPLPAKKRKLRRFVIFTSLALAVIVAGFLMYLNSGSFREIVRQRVITELRRMTGGTVEVESFTWNLSTLHFEARNVTIHGREAASEVPYAHADRIGVDVKIISFFTRKISLENVAIDRVVLHLLIYPDGTTNQPSPQAGAISNEEPTQNLFDLAIKQIAVRQGTLMLDQERIPFDLDGKDISAGMNYVPSQKAYDGHLDFTPLTIAYRNAAPMQAEMHVGFLLRSGETEIKSLRLAVGGSKVEASGTLRSYNNPELTLQYQASLDLAQVGNTAKWKQLRAGRAELKGAGTYQNNRYSSQGNLSVRDLEWRDATARISSMDTSSPYSVTQDKIVLSRLIAHAFGGAVQGDMQISNWASASTAAKKTSPQQGVMRLHLSGVQASKVAAAILSAKMP